jgi:uncharacterized cupredoxin-like copper-binding protein
MNVLNRTRLGSFLAAAALTFVACGGGASPSPTIGPTIAPPASEPAIPGASESMAAGASTVNVTLQEWAVVPSVTSIPAGEVTFVVSNTGPADVHELVILKTDLGAANLPVDDTGAVDETGAGITVVDEIEDIAVGSSGEVTVMLEPGAYVLLCNIFDATEQESHYAMGMRLDFTVS